MRGVIPARAFTHRTGQDTDALRPTEPSCYIILSNIIETSTLQISSHDRARGMLKRFVYYN